MSEGTTAVRKRGSNESEWTTAMLAALLLLCVWGVVVARRPDPVKYWNFGFIHDGALCLQDGCDPYDTRFLDTVGQHHGEAPRQALKPEYPVYPPSTLLLAASLNPLGWPGSALAFFGLSLLAYGAAIAGMVRTVRAGPAVIGSIVLVALLSSRSPALSLYYGNPVLLCAGLVTGACVLLLSPERLHDLAAAVLLALALCIKPQLAIGALLFLLWRGDTRKAAWSALLMFVAFSVLAVLVYAARLHGFAYLGTERRILALGFQPGHSSDGSLQNPNAFRFLNLAPLMSGLSLGRTAAANAVLAITALCAALLLYVGRGRTVLQTRPWTMLALLLLLTCMPLYHREYDRCLLLALAPAAMETEDHPWLRWFVAITALVWFWSEPLLSRLPPRTQGMPLNGLLTFVLFGLLLWSVPSGRNVLLLDAQAR